MRVMLTALVLLVIALPSQAREPDWAVYDALLKAHVAPATHAGVQLNWVDYTALKADPRFDAVVSQLEAYPLQSLTEGNEKLAFYINAYNILALRTVVNHWPLESIKDVGNLFSPVWKREAGSLGGKTVTLDEIEHEILRPMGEPRIHMAIVCASISCPDLRAEAYTATRLDAQLDDQSRRFLANPAKGLVVDDDTLRVSKVFDWFAEDFDQYAGGVKNFIARHAESDTGLKLKADLPYNWAVNGE